MHGRTICTFYVLRDALNAWTYYYVIKLKTIRHINPPPLDVPTNSNQDPIKMSSKLCKIILGIDCDVSSKKFMKKYWGQLTSEHRSTLLAAKNFPGDEFGA